MLFFFYFFLHAFNKFKLLDSFYFFDREYNFLNIQIYLHKQLLGYMLIRFLSLN